MTFYHNNRPVDVTDTFEMNGTMLAVVKARSGKPYIGGDTYPVRTNIATVPASELRADYDAGKAARDALRSTLGQPTTADDFIAMRLILNELDEMAKDL